MSKVDKSKLFNPYSVEIEESLDINEILNYNDILVEIANTIINYRNENNLTQKELAEKLNINQSMISKLESGEYNSTLKMLLKISYKLVGDESLFLKVIENIRNILEYKEEYKSGRTIYKFEYTIEETPIYTFNSKPKNIIKENKSQYDREYKII